MSRLLGTCILLFISIATAEKLNPTIKSLTGNGLNCTTRECVKDNLEFELNMLENMNPSVDPCDNFYEFACGNFHNVPDDIVQDTQHKEFHHVMEDMFLKMIYIIKKSLSLESFKPFNFLRDFLISCQKVNNNNNASYPGIKKDNLDYLKEIISKFGGWPVVEGDKWNETNDNWTNFIDEAKSTDFIFYHFYGLRTRSVNNLTVISFQPMDLEFSREEIRNHNYSEKIFPYFGFMFDVANILGANETQAIPELFKSGLFEMDLVDLKTQSVGSLSRNRNNPVKYSVRKLIGKWPSIDWIKLLNTQSELPSNITKKTMIIIENTYDVTYLHNLVKNTPAKVRANFAMWKTIQKLIPMVESASLSRLLQIYNKAKNPSYVYEPFICFDELTDRFPELMTAYYARKYPIDRPTKTQIHQFVSIIEQEFFDTLNRTKWLDVRTRDELFKVLKSLKIITGYPEEVMDDRKLDEYFQGLNITQDNFLKNVLNQRLFINKKKFAFNHKPEDLIEFVDKFHMLIQFDSDAFFNVFLKTIAVELLRNMFFSIHRPNYVNLAVIGRKLAHEIGHSIDFSYHSAVEFKATDSYWSESSKKVYQGIRECIAEQYNNYSLKLTGRKMNGEFYLNENIADNIGTQIAYAAYQDWVKIHGPEPTFSSLPYNSNQLFWLSFANPWCSPKSSLQNWSSTDTHPSFAHRVIIPLSNSPDFSKDFNCPSGSNMNPVKKCIVF